MSQSTPAGAEHFKATRVLVERAHRTFGPKPAEGACPHPFVVRLHYPHTRDLILKLAAQRTVQGLSFHSAKVLIFPDLTVEMRARRKEFEGVRKRCREAELCYGFQHPACFRITAKDGESRIF